MDDDLQRIIDILPHREPFLFVDRVKTFTPGKRILAEKDIRADDWYLKGHFPGSPLMPGVLVSEALAQVSGLLLGLTWKQAGDKAFQEHVRLCLTSVDMKFSSPALPGDTLCLESGLKKKFGSMYLFTVRAHTAAGTTAKGTLSLAEQTAG